MTWTDSLRRAGSQAADVVRRQSARARKEFEVRRLERQVRSEKARIGDEIYRRLQSGELQLDIQEVQVAVARIFALNDDIAKIRAEIDELANPPGEPGEDESHPGVDEPPPGTGQPDGAG